MAGDAYHLSLSIRGEMWNEILRTALPARLADGQFDLAADVVRWVERARIADRVAGILDDPGRTGRVFRWAGRTRERLFGPRRSLAERFGEWIIVDGTWQVDVDDLGTDLRYGPQRMEANAFVRALAEGRIVFVPNDVEVPFRLERRIGASLALARIRYDAATDAVVGQVEDVRLHLSENVVARWLLRWAEVVVDAQLRERPPIPLLPRAQVSEMLAPMGGALSVDMGVSALRLDVDGDELTLRVRFGFARSEGVELPTTT